MAETEIPQNTENQPITLGQKLLKTREAMGLTVADISDQSHIPRHVIEAIETDRYTPEKITTRGYIRNYAKIVQIPIDEIDQMLMDLGWVPIEQKTHPIKINTKPLSSKNKHVRLTTYAIIIILITLVLTWRHLHHGVEESDIQFEPETTELYDMVQSPSPLLTSND